MTAFTLTKEQRARRAAAIAERVGTPVARPRVPCSTTAQSSEQRAQHLVPTPSDATVAPRAARGAAKRFDKVIPKKWKSTITRVSENLETDDPTLIAARRAMVRALLHAPSRLEFLTAWLGNKPSAWTIPDIEFVWLDRSGGRRDAETTIQVLLAWRNTAVTLATAVAKHYALQRTENAKGAEKNRQRLTTFLAYCTRHQTQAPLVADCLTAKHIENFFQALRVAGAKAQRAGADPAIIDPVKPVTLERYRSALMGLATTVEKHYEGTGITRATLTASVMHAAPQKHPVRIPRWTAAQEAEWWWATYALPIVGGVDHGLFLRVSRLTGLDAGQQIDEMTLSWVARDADSGVWILAATERQKTRDRATKKTLPAPRHIPLREDVVKELTAYAGTHADRIAAHGGRLFGGYDERLILAEHYRLVRPFKLSPWYRDAEGRLVQVPKDKRLTVQDLRHAACVQWITALVPLNVVAGRLGHYDLDLVARYAATLGSSGTALRAEAAAMRMQFGQQRRGGETQPHNDSHNGETTADDVTRAKPMLDNGLSG